MGIDVNLPAVSFRPLLLVALLHQRSDFELAFFHSERRIRREPLQKKKKHKSQTTSSSVSAASCTILSCAAFLFPDAQKRMGQLFRAALAFFPLRIAVSLIPHILQLDERTSLHTNTRGHILSR